MREFKFRAWYGQYNKMAYSDADIPKDISSWDGLNTSRVEMLNHLLKGRGDYTPMQYTGLQDKTGRDIYEGDIVKVLEKYYEHLFIVEWDNETSGFMLAWEGPVLPFGKYYLSLGDDFVPEIIGNIYENPELLPSPTDTPTE